MLKFKPDIEKKKELRPFLIPGVIAIFILVSGLLLIRPRIGEIFSIQKDLKKEEKKLAQLTAKTAALEGLDQVELSEKAEIATKALPTEKDLPLILSALKVLAAENNIELLSLQVKPGELATPSTQEKKEELPLLSFKIEVSGQISDFKEFLAKLVKIAPLMRAKSVAIETEEMGGSFKANISLDSPFLPPPVSLGLPEEPLPQITTKEETVYQKLAGLDFSLREEELPVVPAGKENPFVF